MSRYGFGGWIWVLIASVLDLCIRFTSLQHEVTFNVNVLNMSLIIWLSFVTFVLICSVKLSLLSNMTLKSFSLSEIIFPVGVCTV